MLHFRDLGKSYNGRSIFSGIAHEFGAGAFALQGANGIGKSTLLALLAGAEPADVGEIRVDGVSLSENPAVAREQLSYVPDNCPVYGFITGHHFLEFVRTVRQETFSERFLAILKGFGIESQLAVRFDAMSLGTQKKFLLSAAFIAMSKVFIVDEPTNGLDKTSRAFLAELIKTRAKSGVILFSTHDSDFVQETGAEIVQMEALIAQSGADGR